MATNPDKIQPITRAGYPRDVIEKLNEVIAYVSRDTEYKFDTDSKNPIVKTKDTPDKRVVTLPRGGGNTNGTVATPYEMGENRTTTDPTAADDTWTRADGPTPNTPHVGPFDSVVTTNPRAFFDGTHWILYFRRTQFDSNGAIYAIGDEEAVTLT